MSWVLWVKIQTIQANKQSVVMRPWLQSTGEHLSCSLLGFTLKRSNLQISISKHEGSLRIRFNKWMHLDTTGEHQTKLCVELCVTSQRDRH